MTIKIRESVTEAPVKKGNRWRVIVARPGRGSSGNYSEDMFRRDAHKIIAPGGQMFINHDDSRNPKDMVATYPEGSYWDESEKAVVAEAEVFSHWKEFVEEVGPHCGVSLYALGEADDEGNVTAIIEDRLNGADLVARPGLVGSGLAEKLYESAIAGSTGTKATAVMEGKDNEMELEEKVDALVAKIDALTSAIVAENGKKAEEAAQIEADAQAVASAVEAYDAAVKAVDEADLLAPQREAILSSAKRGEDVTPLIESAKAIKEAALAAVSAEALVTEGRVLGGDPKGFSLATIAEAR